jgi:flagellar hook assembly protein FlgD
VLGQNYPNPFNPITNVKFSILNSGNVKITVYDIRGKEVQTLVNERLQPGTYEVMFDGSMLTSGVYLYRMSANNYSETKKLILIK